MARAFEKPTLVSLFSGAGGLDIGLESAGFQTLVASELEENYCESLRANQLIGNMNKKEFDSWFENQIASQRCYKSVPPDEIAKLKGRLSTGVGRHSHLEKAKIISGDIKNLDSATIMSAGKIKKGQLTMVAGGPPCQPFSRAGKRETVETADGRLYKEFVRVVNDLNPEWFLFENVKGLAQSRTDVVNLHCRDCDLSFVSSVEERDAWTAGKKIKFKCDKCSSTKIDAKLENRSGGSLDMILEEFQRIGYRCHHKILNSADFGVPQTRERLFIVGSRDGNDFQWPEPTHQKVEFINGKPKLTGLEDKKNPWIGMYQALWSAGHSHYDVIDRKKAVLWVKNVVRPHDEPVTWDLNRPSPTIGAHQSAKLAFAPKGVPEDQIFRQQWHTKGRRQGDTPPVFVEHEYLSDQELLIIQSFPANWYLHGTRMERAFQIGNAVPPKLAEVVGQSILKARNMRMNLSKPKSNRQPEATL